MQVFEPRPLKGGCRWTASPRQNLGFRRQRCLDLGCRVRGEWGLHVAVGVVLSNDFVDVPF
jgi:hypothetical protein